MFGLTPSRKARPRRCSAPFNTIVWVVGDIHGQDDLFAAIVPVVMADLAESPDARRVVVLLGDYIDRGLGTRRVMDALLDLRSDLASTGAELVSLRGNHEDFLLQFLDHPDTGPEWMEYGGRETLLAYGVEPPGPRNRDAWPAASDALRKALPARQRGFLAGLRLHHTEEDYHFVHAGVRPGVALADQSAEDMMWIRDAFLKDRRPFDKVIVHGHTPVDTVYVDERRICLDTGSYATGVLSALRLQGQTQLLVQTRRVRTDVTLLSRPLSSG